MDCSNIVRVVDLNGSTDANRYLSLGWVFLCADPGCEEGVAYTRYSLGWPSEKGEPVYPHLSDGHNDSGDFFS